MNTTLQAGVYRANITPPIGISMAGSLSATYATKICGQLYAAAAVFDDGEQEVAIVSVDVCWIDEANVKGIIEKVCAKSAIKPENIIITVTQTHTAPAIGPLMDLYPIDQNYLEVFKSQVATAILSAWERKRPVRVAVGKASNPHHCFNRRMVSPEGYIVANFISGWDFAGYTPEGPIDPEIVAVRLENMDGSPLAFLVHFTNHVNAQGGAVIGPDFTGEMHDALCAVYGSDIVTLSLPGAAGNINWINTGASERWTPDLYKKIGHSLAGSVLEINGTMQYLENNALHTETRILSIPERPFCEYDIKADFTFGDPNSLDAKAFLSTYRYAQKKYGDRPLASFDIELKLLKIGGEIAIVTNPCELFVEFGLEIKRRSPYTYTVPVDLTNGMGGYAPTKEAFAAGGYEVRKLPHASYLDHSAGGRIVAASLEMLHKA